MLSLFSSRTRRNTSSSTTYLFAYPSGGSCSNSIGGILVTFVPATAGPSSSRRRESFLTELLLPVLDAHRDHDPFRVLEQIPLALERDELVDDMMNIISIARVDWKETPNAHFIMLDLPGLKKEDVKIDVVENRVVIVSGERKKEEEKKGDHWHRVERSYGKIWRQFRLPDNVDLDSVMAKLEKGVLTISLAKHSPDKIKRPKVVTIDTSTTNTRSLLVVLEEERRSW